VIRQTVTVSQAIRRSLISWQSEGLSPATVGSRPQRLALPLDHLGDPDVALLRRDHLRESAVQLPEGYPARQAPTSERTSSTTSSTASETSLERSRPQPTSFGPTPKTTTCSGGHPMSRLILSAAGMARIGSNT